MSLSLLQGKPFITTLETRVQFPAGETLFGFLASAFSLLRINSTHFVCPDSLVAAFASLARKPFTDPLSTSKTSLTSIFKDLSDYDSDILPASYPRLP